MIFLKLTEYIAADPIEYREIRMHVDSILLYRHGKSGSIIELRRNNYNKVFIKETPEQIDEMIADAATMRNACVISARIKP